MISSTSKSAMTRRKSTLAKQTAPSTRRCATWLGGTTLGTVTSRFGSPTFGRVPKDVHHGLALLRGAVCREMRETRERGDTVGEARAGKLLTYLDRLVLHAPRSRRGGKHHQGLGKVITARLRLAWRGDWAALWRDAATAGHTSPIRGGRNATVEEDARAINSLVRESMIGKALSRVMSRAAVAVGPQVLSALTGLFLTTSLPTSRGSARTKMAVPKRLCQANQTTR